MLNISAIDSTQLDAIPEPTNWQAPHISELVTEQLFVGTFIMDGSGLVIYADQAAALLLGQNQNALLQQKGQDLLGEEPFASLELSVGQVHRYTTILKSYRSRANKASITLNSSQVDGKILIIASLAVVNDSPDMENALHMNQRLASLGMLTASIAHELKNPINVITNTCDNMSLALEEDGVQSSLSLIRHDALVRKNAWHCARLVETLRSYMHKNQHGHMVPLNSLVNDAISLVQPQFERQKNVSLNLELAEDVGDLMCVTTQVIQIIVNLLTNACDAVDPTDGQVWVKTWAVPEFDSVAISVRDNGRGIPEELIEEIFEPFFTTKRHVDGTGMGLFIAAEIVKRHNGWIRVQNQLNEETEIDGVQFTVMLPRK